MLMADQTDESSANGQVVQQGTDTEMGGMSEEQEAQETSTSPSQHLPPSETYLEPAPTPLQPSPPRSIPADAQDPHLAVNGTMQPAPSPTDHIQSGPPPNTAPSVVLAPAPIDTQQQPDSDTLNPATTSAPPSALQQQQATHPSSMPTTTQSPRPSTPTQTPSAPSHSAGAATPLPTSHIIPPANPQGSSTRVYVNTKVTPWLLEGMKWVAANEPEKPLRWLSEFLDKKSREVEGI